MPLRVRRLTKTNAEKPTRGVLRGIENVVAESPARKSIPVKVSKRQLLSTPIPSKEAGNKALELTVSPIEGPAFRALQSGGKRSGKATSTQVTTSTPDSTSIQPLPPVADLPARAPSEPVSLDDSADSSLSLFDITMASSVKSHTSATSSRALRGQDQSLSPKLTVKKVKRTYSRGSRVLSTTVSLFEEPETPLKDDLNGSFDKLETEDQAMQKKAKVAPKPKLHKQHKQKDAALEEWAKKMAAEFEEIEKFELCVE